MQQTLEYWLVVAVARVLGAMPRWLARLLAEGLAWAVFHAMSRLRRVGERNLSLALPGLPKDEQGKILRSVYRYLGWQLVEFCRMPGYTRENTQHWIRTDGLEHYLAAEALGRGVLVLTGHLGAWELSSFYHSLMGHPMGMVIRRLDNRRLDEFVNGIRCLHGNRVLHKDDFARGLLTAMREGGHRRHPDGHQHDATARRIRRNFSGSPHARPRASRASRSKPAPPFCPALCCGSPRKRNTFSTSAARCISPKPVIRRPTFLPRRSNATTCSSPGFAAIPSNGCGFIAAGKPALPANLRSTDPMRQVRRLRGRQAFASHKMLKVIERSHNG